MTDIRFRPLRWQGPSTPHAERRSRWTFKAPYEDTLVLLVRELGMLAAHDVVIEADFAEQHIRQDGLPRSNAPQPRHPGVRVAFNSMYGPLIYATDVHELWKHNLRAIALGLEALRKVDRYGVTKRGEQYTGWKALPGGVAMPGPMTVEQAAAEYIRMGGGDLGRLLRDRVYRDMAYRRAARAAHPDTSGFDSTADFQRLQEARRVLDQADPP